MAKQQGAKKMQQPKIDLRCFERKAKSKTEKITMVKSTEPKLKSQRSPANPPKHKCHRAFCWDLEADHCEGPPIHRVQIDHGKLKPKPLDFRIDMLDKGYMHSSQKKNRKEPI